MSLSLKEILNQVLGRSAFLQRDTFASQADPDSIQMVAYANRVAMDILAYYPWPQLRKSATVTLTTDLEYDLPADFDYYVTETMWKAYGARPVTIPTQDRSWAYLKSGNPTTTLQYQAKLIDNQLVFASVTEGDVIQYDYISKYGVLDVGDTPKLYFTEDTDTWRLNDNTLINGICAAWKTEKEMPTAENDRIDYQRDLRRDIAAAGPAKAIRQGGDRFVGPLSSDYMW